jgi:DNA-binding ferritin-like protein
MDIIKLDVPLFIRLLELAREDVKQDADLHDVAEAVIKLSQQGVATMADYDSIVAFMQKQGDPATEELDRIKQLGGIYQRVQTEFKETE